MTDTPTQLLDDAATACTTAARHVDRALRDIPERRRRTLLAALEDAATAADRLDEGQRQLVEHLRATDASWATIAGALGVSKQAAAQRFGAKPARVVETGPTLLDDLDDQVDEPAPAPAHEHRVTLCSGVDPETRHNRFRAECACGWVSVWATTNAVMGRGRRHATMKARA